MILNKAGQTFEYEGKSYMVGAEIIGPDESEYEGLFGVITEIRDGADKETENETPDIYCTFYEPITPYGIKELEKRFSDLYDESKKMEDIILDSVIMAPYMIKVLPEMEKSEKVVPVYTVTTDWATEDASDITVKVVPDLSSAKKEMRRMIKKERKCGGIFDMRGKDGIVEESSELSYEIYSEGFYCSSHFSIRIEEKELRCSPEFIERLMLSKRTGGKND